AVVLYPKHSPYFVQQARRLACASMHIGVFGAIRHTHLISRDMQTSIRPCGGPRQPDKLLMERRTFPLDGAAASVEHGVHMPRSGVYLALALSEEVVKSRRLLASLTGLALLLVSVSAQAIKPPMPRSKAQLAGVWVGPDAWGSVLRLELNSEGQGLLVVRDLDSKGDLALYKVELAKININDLSFSVSPISNGAARIALSGTNDSNAINLVRY